MSRSDPIRPTPDGLLHCPTLWNCSYSILEYVPNPSVPFVWLHRHTPEARVAWTEAEVPLISGGGAHSLAVRGLEYDALMTTEGFLELLPELSVFNGVGGPGMDLFQMAGRVPDTLRFRPENKNMNRILVQNGLSLKLALPHPYEVALLCTTDAGYLEKLLKIPAVREIAH